MTDTSPRQLLDTPLRIAPATLRGQTVLLEPYEPAFLDEVAGAALASPEIFRYLPVRVASREDVVARFEHAARVNAERTGVFFVTRLLATGELVGSTAAIVTDAVHRRVEIGYTWIVPRFQRTVVNTEAKYLQMRHCFEDLGAIRVEFKTDARNARSRSALAGIGATEEGILRSHMICWDGTLRDSVYFSVTRGEWPRVKAHLEARMAPPGGSLRT